VPAAEFRNLPVAFEVGCYRVLIGRQAFESGPIGKELGLEEAPVFREDGVRREDRVRGAVRDDAVP
jgi:hypothetical protein